MTIYLPHEILAAIFEQFDDFQDLCSARMASRALCAAATPIAFRALSMNTTRASAKNLGRLFDLPDIAAHIMEVSYHDTGPDEKGWFLGWSPKYVKTKAIRKLESSLSRIHQLPRLETINLTFDPVRAKPSGDDLDGQRRAALQESILRALAASFSVRAPSKLTSLSLYNLRTSDPPPLETFPFQTILTTLRRLQLSVIYDATPDPSIGLARWHHFWSTLFPPMPAVPIQTQFSLTELILHSNYYVGPLSGLSFRELHFPRLSVLSLRGIIFDPHTGAEEFILRHAGTLAWLELLECKVLMSGVELSSSRYWDRIWDRFAAELTALVTLVVDEPHDNRRPRCHTPVDILRYISHRTVSPESFSLIIGDESRVAADFAALQRLDMTVVANARSKEWRVES